MKPIQLVSVRVEDIWKHHTSATGSLGHIAAVAFQRAVELHKQGFIECIDALADSGQVYVLVWPKARLRDGTDRLFADTMQAIAAAVEAAMPVGTHATIYRAQERAPREAWLASVMLAGDLDSLHHVTEQVVDIGGWRSAGNSRGSWKESKRP